MLTKEQEEIISAAIQPLFQYLEHEVIVDFANRIKESLSYTRTAELQAIAMRELGYSPAKIRREAMKLLKADEEFRKMVALNTLQHKRTVKKMLEKIQKEACKANSEIMSGAGNMAYADDLSVWKDAGKTLTDDSYLSQLVKAFAKQTEGELKNLTQTTGFKTMSGFESMENLYRRELDKALIKVCSGTFSKEKVIKDTVHELAQSGLRTIDFESGYSMQLDTAVRLAMRTGAHQLSGKIMDKNMEQTGENLVYVSKHWGARNTGEGVANHENWQGKVYYIKDGTDYSEEAKRIGQDLIMNLWYATGYSIDGKHENDPLGLYGYNCRHRYYVWFLGISSLPDEQEQPKPITIDGKTYDYYAVTQKMRSMERSVRALKREKEALGKLGMDTKEIDVKIKRKVEEYQNFCEKCNVKEKTERMRYECGTSDLKKTKAWNGFEVSVVENKGLTTKTDGSTIKVEGETMSLEYQRYGRNKETLVNNTYIESGEYRNKFDKISDNKNVSRVLYAKAKEMLQHRSGTMYEDMYWIDGDTGEIIASALDEKEPSAVAYTDKIKKKITGKKNLITMHTHPSSMPPSVADFNSNLEHGYATSLVICHDGTVYTYTSKQKVESGLYILYINRYIKEGYTDKVAQLMALEKLKENYEIDFWEVE